MTTVCLQVVR
jgi:hypothetical protein